MTEVDTATPAIEKTVRIAAPPEAVWSLWTEPDGLRQWWAIDAQVVAEPGGQYRIVIQDGVAMRGEFVELDPPRRLVFTFGWETPTPAGVLPPGSTRVEVTLTPDGADTILVLRHFALPAVQVPDHTRGWDWFVGQRLVEAATG